MTGVRTRSKLIIIKTNLMEVVVRWESDAIRIGLIETRRVVGPCEFNTIGLRWH